MSSTKNNLLGATYGSLIGDVLSINKSYKIGFESPMPYGTNSAFTLCTMANIEEYNFLDMEDLFRKFQDVYVYGYMCPNEKPLDVSGVTMEAIRKSMNGLPADRAGLRTEGSDTNAPLCRIMPVIVFYAREGFDKMLEQVNAVCAMTQHNPESKVCSSLIAALAFQILNRSSAKIFDLVYDFYKNSNHPDYEGCLETVEKVKTRSADTEISHTFWDVWDSFAPKQEDFKGSILSALSRDMPNTACVVGMLSGLRNGLDKIPARWQTSVIMPEEADGVINSFVNVASS